MDFNQSKTKINLARAFAGECQAGARYQFLAKTCADEGYQVLNATLKTLAKEEMAHAQIHYNFLQTLSGEGIKNIDIEAGYPFPSIKLQPGFLDASLAELSEHKNIYPSFAKIAKDEGFKDVARAFEEIAIIEGKHFERLKEIADNLEKGTLYKKANPVIWKCTQCGYEQKGKACFKKCPLCGISQGYAQSLEC